MLFIYTTSHSFFPCELSALLTPFFLSLDRCWLPSNRTIRLTHLRHVALDLDRFYAFVPVSLPLLRHASETLTSLTVKPSCGWTLLQVLERFPSIRRIHYVDQFPNSSSLLNYRPPCPVAFEQIIFTSVSRHGFRPLYWLLSHPALKLDLLEIGNTLPEPHRP